MAGVFGTAGAKIYIGQTLSAKTTDFSESDFDSQSWVEIGWWQNAGEFGDESAEVTGEFINPNRAQKMKGVRNAGVMNAVFGLDYEDEGQIALRNAEADANNYAIKVEFNDAPSGGTPSERLFIARVMSAREELGGGNDFMRLNAALSINSNIVRVDASA